MEIFADLHIHGRFSQATSKDLTIETLEKYARIKGINLLGTGDFTHPKWIKELRDNLTEDCSGILKTKSGFDFLLSTEISLIYSQGGKGRRVHLIILAPSLEVVGQITEYLLKKGRVDYDGRPIFGISCDEFVYEMKKISEKIEVIPAHIWTPWFSLFGSKSGFDKVEECFKDQTKHIYALETGLSSDPEMNWRLSALDKYNLVSFSDLHSFWPWRIGREATIFDLNKLSYESILKGIRTGEGLKGTIEFWPHEGKYHYDGHRKCNVCMNPRETVKHKKICPKCGKELTIGVAYRVEELADRKPGFKPKNARDFKNIIPLSECIAGVFGTVVASKKVWAEFNNLINAFGTELNTILNISKEDLLKVTNERIAGTIIKNREQKIKVIPGYDGEYGKPIFDKNTVESANDAKKEEKGKKEKVQKSLFDF